MTMAYLRLQRDVDRGQLWWTRTETMEPLAAIPTQLAFPMGISP